MGELQTDFLTQLERVVKREQVDLVVCTHLHFDHVGWNTMKQGDAFVPTFPNARYLFGRTEFEHWDAVTDDPNFERACSIDPVIAAGLHELVEMIMRSPTRCASKRRPATRPVT